MPSRNEDTFTPNRGVCAGNRCQGLKMRLNCAPESVSATSSVAIPSLSVSIGRPCSANTIGIWRLANWPTLSQPNVLLHSRPAIKAKSCAGPMRRAQWTMRRVTCTSLPATSLSARGIPLTTPKNEVTGIEVSNHTWAQHAPRARRTRGHRK